MGKDGKKKGGKWTILGFVQITAYYFDHANFSLNRENGQSQAGA